MKSTIAKVTPQKVFFSLPGRGMGSTQNWFHVEKISLIKKAHFSLNHSKYTYLYRRARIQRDSVI